MPLVAAALDGNAGSAIERLRQIAAHSSARERYTTLELIHDGPGGRVLRVWDEDLQREVALKEVVLDALHESGDARDSTLQDERLARFIDEARITSQLDHPGIVGVHEIAADADGRVYYTMPLVRGSTFAQVIERFRDGDATASLPRAVGIVATVCEAVAYAHARGVVHQDLKPENILVGSFGEAIVTDWGLARVLERDDARRRKRIAGTLAYMAPEVPEEGGSVLADVYALGATLYALLTGRTPHESTVLSGEGRRPLDEVLRKPPRSVLELAPEAPRELVAVVERAMAREPADRYPDAGALARDLRAWLESRVVHAYESGPLAELRKWHRRNRGLALALHSLAVLALLSAGVVWWLQTERAREVAVKAAEVERRGYAAELRQADLSLRAGLAAEARAALSACEPALRGWEWSHLDFAADSSLLAVHPFADAWPTRLVAGRDGTLLVGGSDGALALLDGESCAPLQVLPRAHAGAVRALCTSRDGTVVFSASWPGALASWDAATLAALRTYDLGDLRPNVLVAVDAERLFFLVPEGGLHVLDLKDGGTRTLAAGSSGSNGMALAGAPARLVVCLGDSRVQSFDPFLPEAPPVVSSLHRDVRALAALGDDALLVGTWEGELLVLDPSTLAPLHPGRALSDQRIQTLTTSRDGRVVLVGTAGGAMHVLEYADRSLRPRGRLLGHTGAIVGALIHADPRRMTSASNDGTLRRWDADRSATRLVRISSLPGLFDLSEAGGRVAAAGFDGAVVSSPLHGDEPAVALPPQGAFPSIAFAGEGELLAIAANPEGRAGSEVRLFDARTGAPRGSLAPARGKTLALDSDARGARLATRGDDGHARVWSVASRELLLDFDGLDVLALALSAAGERLAVAGDSARLRILDVSSGSVLSDHALAAPVTCLAFTADDEVLWIGDMSGRLLRLDLTDDEPPRLVHQELGRLRALAVTPDGSRLAIASGEDPTVRIRDAATGTLVLTLLGHEVPPHALAFGRSGLVLASAATDNQVRLWTARP